MAKTYPLNTFLLLFPVLLPVFGARSMNEAKINVHGSVFADLIPYGFQQCARKCENSGYCQAFQFEREHLRCMLIWSGRFPTRFSSSAQTTAFSATVRTAYGKHAPNELSSKTCSPDSRLIMAHNGEAICVKGCGFPPIIQQASVRTMVAEAGKGDYTRAGSVVRYFCNDYRLTFNGGPITCLTSGQWSHTDTLRGCSVLSNGICNRTEDCVSVASSVCQNGLCTCPKYATYVENNQACITDCRSLYDAGQTTNGTYDVVPNGVNRMKVWCLNDWVIIHRRLDLKLDFQTQTWESYKNGFGAIHNNYWVGLDNLNILTQIENEIFIKLAGDNEMFTLKHRKFRVYNESTRYTMTVSKAFTCTHTMAQSFLGLYESNGAAFTTIYNEGSLMCALFNGPWWYTANCTTLIQSMNGPFEDMAILLPENITYMRLFPVRKTMFLIRRIEE